MHFNFGFWIWVVFIHANTVLQVRKLSCYHRVYVADSLYHIKNKKEIVQFVLEIVKIETKGSLGRRFDIKLPQIK